MFSISSCQTHEMSYVEASHDEVSYDTMSRDDVYHDNVDHVDVHERKERTQTFMTGVKRKCATYRTVKPFYHE